MNNNTEKNEKKPYVAPELTTVSFKTERGYANSTLIFTLGVLASSQNGIQDYELQSEQTWF